MPIPILVTLQDTKPYGSKRYAKMWYNNSWCVGIRRKFGNAKQIFSLGGRTCKLSKEVLHQQFGEDCLKKLDAGMAESDVKEWVTRAIM